MNSLNQVGYAPYTPKGPYTLFSGKYRKKTVDAMSIHDIHWFFNLYSEVKKHYNPNSDFHNHVRWIHQQMLSKKTCKLCPHCDKEVITHFGFIDSTYGFVRERDYLYCQECEKDKSGVSTLTVSFANLVYFTKNQIKGEILDLFKYLFDMPKRINGRTAFEFFKRDANIQMVVKKPFKKPPTLFQLPLF